MNIFFEKLNTSKGKHKGSVGKSKRGHGVKCNPQAKVLEQYTNIGGLLFRKDVKPEIEE